MSYYTYMLEASAYRHKKIDSTSDPFALDLNPVSNYRSLVDSGSFLIKQKLNLHFNNCDTNPQAFNRESYVDLDEETYNKKKNKKNPNKIKPPQNLTQPPTHILPHWFWFGFAF